MQKFLRGYSLKRDYFVLTSAIIIVITAISLLYAWNIYTNQQELKRYNLHKTTLRIEAKFREPFEYIDYLVTFMGKQIVQGNPNDLHKIREILQGNLVTDPKDKQKFSWSAFDWSRPDRKMIISTAEGQLKKPIDISFRHYAKVASEEPWVLHFDAPDLGVTSRQLIIPSGMGITDDHGKFVGILSLGINVAKFTKNIEDAIDKESINFIILDQNDKIALHSSDDTINKISKDYFKSLLPADINQGSYGVFTKDIQLNGITYSSYMKVSGYPYTILVGYNNAIIAKEFRNTLLPTILGFSIIGIVSLILLLIIRKMIVAPVIELSTVADQLSKGVDVKRIRGGRTYEINNLALQLIKLKRFLHCEQKVKQKQRDLLKIIRDSDHEKEMFLRELYHAMNTPLNVVIAIADLLKKRGLGEDISKYDECFDVLSNASKQLVNYTTDIINPSSVDVKEIIHRCVTLQKKKASEIRLKMELSVADDIPPIMIDELRIRQVLIGTLGQALFCIQDFGTIKISAVVKKTKAGKPSKLIIVVEDDGLGVGEQERAEQWERAFGNPDHIHAYSRNPDITRMSFPVIRHLIALHRGSFELKAISGVGSVFTITLPYLTKKELETTPKDLADITKKDLSKGIESAVNIIKFPRNI